MEKNLFTVLNEAASALLNDSGIYSVLDYAWEGEDEPSAEFIGLAMWTTDAPFKPSWHLWDRSSPPKKPSLQDETFYRAGEDFIGTMEMARKAIGLALYSFQNRKPDNLMDDDEDFWEQYGAAAVWLNAASDRIRDYFLMARHGKTAKEYKKSPKGGRQRSRNSYAHPFRFADPNETPNARLAAEQLAIDAKQLDRRRSSRNKMIHDVTSRQGRSAVESVRQQRKEASQIPYTPRRTSDVLKQVGSWDETLATVQAERRKQLQTAIEGLKDWYLLLIHACGLAIEYEYWKRIKK